MTGCNRVISYIIGQNKLLLGTRGDGNGGKIGQKRGPYEKNGLLVQKMGQPRISVIIHWLQYKQK